MSTQCNVAGCANSGKIIRRMCTMHYQRWRTHGDPLAGRAYHTDPEESFAARVAWDGQHLTWIGATDRGYGQLWVGGRMVKAHRFAWERENGSIPEGMVIDHTCHVRACVHADHLRLATVAQNNANRSGAWTGRDLPRGVSRNRAGNRYRACVRHNGRDHYLGTYFTPEEASAVAVAKRKELFGEYAGA